MKNRFSLSRLLHNERLVFVISLVAAIVVWALVSFGPGNINERQIVVPVTVDLTNTIAGYNDLRVIGENTFSVTVTVEGPRSVVFNLDSSDIVVKPSLSDVQGPGQAELLLTASKAGNASDYSITSIYPPTVTVNCDYWIAQDFPLTTDLSAISVADSNQQLGDVVVDNAAVPNGVVRIEGPRSVISRIDAVVAKVETATTISKTERFSAKLVAIEKDDTDSQNDKEVDLTDCQFLTPAAGTVDITVPVWVQKKVEFVYQLVNVPQGLADKNLVTLSMPSITLVGEAEELDSVAESIADLGIIDFDHLEPENSEFTISLNIPTSVQALGDTSVTVTLDIDRYDTKQVSFTVNGIEDVTVKNLPADKTLTLQEQKITNIVLCGDARLLNRITEKDLVIELDAAGNTGNGSVRYGVKVLVPEYPTVWVYYGDASQSGYILYGTLS